MVQIDSKKCVGCGLCAADCISLNIQVEAGKANVQDACFLCGHCVAICPKNAVSISEYDMEDVENYEEGKFTLEADQFLRSIKFRRSIRDFKQQKVEQKVLEQLLQAGRYTATAKNSQNCCFVFVQEKRDELKQDLWEFIDQRVQEQAGQIVQDLIPYAAFNERRKADPQDDYLFRNAPVVLYITAEYALDAGLAAQNIENMAAAMGMGALYNGYLANITNQDQKVKEWLGIADKEIRACMLLGYPGRSYWRTAPRREADVRWR